MSYISKWINYLLMQFQMKKEEKSHLDKPKPRSIYKYELKATNQILRDTLELCHSSLLNTATSNRHNKSFLENRDQNYHHLLATKKNCQGRLQSSNMKNPSISEDYYGSKQTQKAVIYENLSDKDLPKQFKAQHRKERLKEWDYIDKNAFINSEFYSFSENSSNSKQKYSEGQLDQNQQTRKLLLNTKKDLKRQRRGLADISLKVKNIVARLGKMTFKEVSDQVLKESEQDLPNQPQQKEKETKNIRRRVYDALNVLVAVGILAKEQRCVVHTQFTKIRGKKLSQHYDIVAERNRSLKEHVQTYQKKLANLNLLQKNFQTLLLFHERNKSQPTQKRQEHTKQYSIQLFSKGKCDKFYFPLIFLLPPKIMTQKIIIQIQHQDLSSEYIRKYLIEGTDYILTDLDTLKYLNLDYSKSNSSYFGLDKSSCLYFLKEKKKLRKFYSPSLQQSSVNISEDEIYQSD